MGAIQATDRDGSLHELQGRERASIMGILRHAEALCSGGCQCATCHVYIGDNWLDKLPPPTEFETTTLEGEGVEVRPNSRLSCQIRWQDDLDGIELIVAPGD